MNIYAIIFGFLIATVIGAVFFRIRPVASYRRLWLCLLVSWGGFAVGHFTAELLNLRLWMAGALNLSGGIPGSLIALVGMQILALRDWK